MKRIFFLSVCATLIITLTACVTTGSTKDSRKAADPNTVHTYRAPGLKIEAEAMLVTGTSITEDAGASGGQYVPLAKESDSLETRIQLKEGTYELLLKMRARDTDRSFLTVTVDDTSYSVYPSNPPLGVWELTTRIPVYIQVDSPKTITIRITADKKKKAASKHLCIDYLQLVSVNK